MKASLILIFKNIFELIFSLCCLEQFIKKETMVTFSG